MSRPIADRCLVLQVGNKMDLEGERAVTQSEAKSFAEREGMLYTETSAKENVCVSETFEVLATSILDQIAPAGP